MPSAAYVPGMNSLADLTSASISEQTEQVLGAIETSLSGYENENGIFLLLALAAHSAEKLGNDFPVLDRIEDLLVRVLLMSGFTSYGYSRETGVWNSFYLTNAALFGLLNDETPRIVVSKSGMLHSRFNDDSHTDCSKPISGTWLPQFHRGGNIHSLYLFGMKCCSHCMNGALVFPREEALSKEQFASGWQTGEDAARLSIRAALNGEFGEWLRTTFPVTDASLAKLPEILFSNGSPLNKKSKVMTEVLCGIGDWSVRSMVSAESLKLLPPVRAAYAADLAERILAAERRAVMTYLLTPSKGERSMPNLVGAAEMGYGELANVELPKADVLSELLTHGVGGSHPRHPREQIETVVIPNLLVSTWLETMMPHVRELWPENGGRLHATILTAYRQMPGRAPKHTLGTHLFDLDGFVSALDHRRKNYGMSWESVAAETNLAIERIQEILDGAKPNIDTFMTLSNWLQSHQAYAKTVK